MVNTSPFWIAYNSAIREHLVPGVTIPDNNEIFALPFAVPLTLATRPLTDEELNYLIYILANTTLAADGSIGNYAEELSAYLNNVDESSFPEAVAEVLHKQQMTLKQALDTEAHHQPYNMPVHDSDYKPSYSSLSLKDQLKDWINNGNKKSDQLLFEVKIDSAMPPGWVEAEGGIYLKFTTKGVGKFDVRAGKWDIPGVKTLYPKQKQNASKVLDPKYAQTISALVAYDPRLELEIREDDGQSGKLQTEANDEPYVAVLGVLVQHFPLK